MPMNTYLESSDCIDWRHPLVSAKAGELAAGADDPVEIARRCFRFVRDEIRHSWDYRLNPVTCRASEVLAHGTGYCYAKSHLLAALLRANAIPAGFCYQRLIARRLRPSLLPARPERGLAGGLRLVPHRPPWQQARR